MALRPLLYIVGWLAGVLLCVPASGASAGPAPDTAIIRRIPLSTVTLGLQWRAHSGDNPAWARPAFDDHDWDTLNPLTPRGDLPTPYRTGISWWRRRLRLGDSLRRRELLLHFWQMGAVEVYLDGRLISRQGTVAANPLQVQPRGTFPYPAEIPAGGPAEQVLAVRYAPWQSPWLVGLDDHFQLWVGLTTARAYLGQVEEERTSAVFFLVLAGVGGLLALLHYGFYRFKAQEANRYFARFALAIGLAAALAYVSATSRFASLLPYWVPLTVLVRVIGAMTGLWIVRALYSLFDFPRGWVYKGLWVAYGALAVHQCVAILQPGNFVPWILLMVLSSAEQVRLTWQAWRQRQRGVGIIAAGFVAGLVVAVGFAAALLSGVVINAWAGNVLPALLALLPAIGISLYLAREFGLDAQLLRVKLAEVERLSAQTLAQEQEKQALLEAHNETLEHQVEQRTAELQRSLTDLRATQEQLIQREKMASLGELTAGIAHEIQNPLNFVTNFSEVSAELVDELEEELAANHPDDVRAIADDLKQNLHKISEHGRRAAGIVRGMLAHSRSSTGERIATDLNVVADEALRLAYHGGRAREKDLNATLVTDFDPALRPVEVVAADISRVLLNLFTNAFYAVRKRQQAGEAGYQPTVTVQTRAVPGGAEIRVRDNGTGVPESVKAKIFQPFFTTKPTGEGTGLGLSLSYDIVTKGHGGTLAVESAEA